MEYKPYCARTSEDLRIASKQHGDKSVIWQLDRDDLVSSASRWNLRHVIAYRLLVQPEAVFLPILATDHALRCPICSAEDRPLTQKLNPIGTQNLTGENPRDLRMMTESDIMRLPEGFFWAALARAIRPEITDEDRVYPQRERKPVRREGYMNSAMAIVGSSSPPPPPSSSEFEVEVEGLDQDEHEDRRSKPEEVTVHLVTAFLQFALNLCLCQHTVGIITDSEVRTRVERRKTKTFIGGMIPVAAGDDGGICQLRRRALGWEMSHPYLAILEAKRAFRYVSVDDKTGRRLPVVSNETLAQYLGEAVVAWKENQPLLSHGVFLIAATSTFVRLVHFTFGRDYAEYLDAPDEESQLKIVGNEDKDATVQMQSTRWFDLESSDERRVAFCHILALLRWHEDRDASVRQDDERSDTESDDSDDSMNSNNDGKLP